MENEKYRSTSMSHYVEEDSDWNGAEQSYDQDFFDEDYEYDAEKQVTWVGRIVSIMGLLLSLVIVGTTGYLLNSSEESNAGVYRKFYKGFESAGGLSLFNSVLKPLKLLQFMSVVSIVFYLFSTIFFRKMKMVENWPENVVHPKKAVGFKIFTVATLFLGLVQALFALPLMLASRLFLKPPLDAADASPTSSAEQLLMDYENAIFNTCCEAQGYAEHSAVPECTFDSSVDCSFLTGDLSSFSDILCTCIENPGAYEEYVKYIEAENLCSVLEKARVTVQSDMELPGTTYSLSFIIEILYGDTLFDNSNEVTIPVVGFHRFDENDLDNTFGCGIGFAKGFMFIVQLLGQQYNLYAFLVLLVSSLLQAGLAVMSYCCFRISVEDEFGEERDVLESASLFKIIRPAEAGLVKNQMDEKDEVSKLEAKDELSQAEELEKPLISKRNKIVNVDEFLSEFQAPEFDMIEDPWQYARSEHDINKESSEVSVTPERSISIKRNVNKRQRGTRTINETFLTTFRRPSFDGRDDNQINLDDF